MGSVSHSLCGEGRGRDRSAAELFKGQGRGAEVRWGGSGLERVVSPFFFSLFVHLTLPVRKHMLLMINIPGVWEVVLGNRMGRVSLYTLLWDIRMVSLSNQARR